MEKLREKRVEMIKQLEELEERERDAKKKIARLNEIISKDKNEAETLRRSCRFTEYNVDKKEDFLEEKEAQLKKEQKRKEEEGSILKVLEERELEIDSDIDRLEPRVKQAQQRADDSQMKYMEVVRKLAMAESESIKVMARKKEKEEQVRMLYDVLKVSGRNIHRLEMSEEKSGDREDEYLERIYNLKNQVSTVLMRAEEGERRCRRLENEKDMIEVEANTYKKNYKMMNEELLETLNHLDCV